MVKGLTSALTWLGIIVCAYTLMPFTTAAILNNAIRNGNAPVMNALIDWPAIKASLKRSILSRLDEKALVRPDNPGWMQSVKYTLTDTISPYMVDYVLARRVTPEGFTTYLGPNSPMALKARAAGLDPDHMPSGGMMQRIRRANFLDLTHFQFEVVDKWDQGKVFLAVMELRDFVWRLSSVEMLSLGEGA